MKVAVGAITGVRASTSTAPSIAPLSKLSPLLPNGLIAVEVTEYAIVADRLGDRDGASLCRDGETGQMGRSAPNYR
jgi:hypothetical protein